MPDPIPLTIPTLGESISEATIAKWLKADGDTVGPDDIVAELETDKAAVELPAGAAGIFKPVVPAGATVKVGDVVAHIDPAGQSAGTPEPKPETRPPETPVPAPAPPPATPPTSTPTANPRNPEAVMSRGTTDVPTRPAPAPTPPPTPAPALALITPIAAPTPFPSRPLAPGEQRQELSKLRQTIARRLVEAQHATASLTTFNEVDMSAILALREKYKDTFEKMYGIGLGFMSFFAKAIVYALRSVPELNDTLDGTTVIKRPALHLGIAVSTDRGLMVPIVRNANALSMPQIESEIKRLATKARDGKITVDELAGGTFSITNGGVFGSLLSTPILNPPQSGILGMHKIQKRPVVVQEPGAGGAQPKDTIAIRPMMYLALTYDHRLIDGRQSVTFLVKVKEALEDPTRILLDI